MKNQNVYAVNVKIYTDEYQHDHKVIATYANKKDAHDHAKRINKVVTDIRRRERENEEYKQKQKSLYKKTLSSYFGEEYWDDLTECYHKTIKDEYKDLYKTLKVGDYVISAHSELYNGLYQIVEFDERVPAFYKEERMMLKRIDSYWHDIIIWHDYPKFQGETEYKNRYITKSFVPVTDEQVIKTAKKEYDFPHKVDQFREYFIDVTFDNAYLDCRQNNVCKAEVLKLRIQ